MKDPNILPSECSLVITCLDLVENEYRYTVGGEIVSHPNEDAFVEGIANELGVKFENVHRVRSPDALFEPYEQQSELEKYIG